MSLRSWLRGQTLLLVTLALTIQTGFAALASAATYYSQGSVSPNTLTNWNTVRGGGGTSPANFSANDIFVIQSPHNMGTTASWTLTGVSATIQIESGGTLTANNIVAVAIFQIDNGGTYVHNAVSGGTNGLATDIPGTSLRTFGATSTVEIQKWANGGTSPVGLPNLAWGNLKINVATLAGSWGQLGNLQTVNGNLIIQSTGGTPREFRLNANSPATSTLTVGGDIQVSGGIFNLTSGTAVETVNLGGNLAISGGVMNATGAGPHNFNFTGGSSSVAFSLAGGALSAVNLNWTVAAAKTLSLNNIFTVQTGRSFVANGPIVLNAPLTNSGSTSINSSLTLNSAGGIAAASPTYGGSSTLIYNPGSTVATGLEWVAGATAGLGVPQNVTVQSGTISTSAARTVPGTLTCNTGATALTLGSGSDLTVKGTLALNADRISTSTSKVILPAGAGLTRSSGYVVGALQKNIAVGSSIARSFEVGDASNYSPADVVFASVTGTGDLSVSTTVPGTPPAAGAIPTGSGISQTNYLNRNWTFSNGGPAFTTYDATFNFVGGDVQGGANTAQFIVGKNSGGVWSHPTVGTRTSTSTQITGNSAFSTFSLGEFDCPPITLSPAAGALPGGNTGVAYSQTITASGGLSPYSFAVTSGTLPAGLSLAGGGALTGTPTAVGSSSFTVTATDANGCTGSAAYTLAITCPTITLAPAPGALTGATTGNAYSNTITASGGTAPYTFALQAGALPAGISLAAGGGLSGTPTSLGSASFTVRATDAYGCTGDAAYTLDVTCGTVAVSPVSGALPGGTTGVAYSQTISASGGTGPYTFALSLGTLPAGLTLSGGGALTGTPTLAGSSSFDVTATDANGCTGVASYTLAVTCPAIALSPVAGALPGGNTGVAYSQTISGSGGTAPYSFAVTLGSLPAGLSLAGSGALTGTPTLAGSSSFTVTATDANGCTGLAAYTLDITCPAIAVSPASGALAGGTTGSAYSQTFTASGGSAPYAFAVSSGSVPTGLTLSGAGVLSGTATAAGSYSFDVMATDADNCTGTSSYSIVISSPGGTNTINVANAAACITPVNACQTIPVNITRTDATGLRLFSVTFQLSPELQLCGPAGSNVLEGTYLNGVSVTSFLVTSNGGGSYTADGTILGLPCGATAASGNLFNIKVTNTGGSGTGTVTVTNVVLRDCANATIASTIGTSGSVTIDSAPVTVAAISTPQTVAEQATLTITPSATLTACASGPVTWSVSPALPAGASFSTSTGVITWTPDCAAGEGGASGTYGPFTLTATAASGDLASSNAFSIHVTDTPGMVAVVVSPHPQTVEELSLLTVTPALTVGGCANTPAPVWSISPSLPAGASFSTSSGVITWTPACGEAATYGPFTLTATVTNGAEVYSGNDVFSIVVTHKVGTVTVAAIADPQNGIEGSLLTVTPSVSSTSCAAGPFTWTVSPTLPSGASLNPSSGVITWTPTCGQAGSYGPFTLTATAATLEVGSSNAFNIVIAHLVGTVTVAAIGDPQNVTENSPLTITPSATTTPCAGSPLTWSVLPALPAGATFSTSTGVITWTPTCGQSGSYGPFTLKATATTGEFGNSNAFNIVVAHLVGTVAVAAIGDPQNVTEGSLLTVTPSATTTPCAGSPLTWTVAPPLPAGATFSSSSGVITWTPTCGQAGSYGPFTLTATATTGEFGNSNAFSIVVAHLVGTVTVAAIGDPQNATEGSLLTVTPSATTTPCAGSPLTWTIAPTLPAGATFSSSSGVITWTPTCGQAGSYGPFTLTATATTGEIGNSNAFNIVVAHLVGTVTVAAIGDPQNGIEGSLLTVTPSATTTPCAGSPLTWTVAPSLPAGASLNPSSGEITWTPTCGQAGSYGPFTLTATAATLEVGSSNAFNIVIAHLVGTVTVAAIGDPQNVTETSPLTITPSATTSPCAGSPLTWSVLPALPAGATFSTSTGIITWTPTCGQSGSYGPFTLKATATTGEFGTSNAFSIVVAHLTGTVTVAAIGDPQNATEGSLLTITPSATTTPCAGSPLTWTVAPPLPAGATLSSSSGVITWTPSCGQAGSYGPFTLTATATTGEIGNSNAFNIVVAHLTGTVTVAAIASPQNATEGSLLTVTPSATTTPCAGSPLTWTVAPPLPAGASLSSSSGVITWTPTCGQAGSYGPFVLTATATTGEIGNSNGFNIVVAHLVGSVAVSVSDPQTVNEGSLLTITPGLVTTPCVNAGSIVWSITPALPGGASLSTSTGVITWTPSCSQSGTYGPFTLTATAGTGEFGSAAFSIVVNNVPIVVAAPASISAAQVLLGNPAGERTGIVISFPSVAGATTYKVYRAPFGAYPEYNDAGGVVPTAPTTWPPSAPWTLTSVTTSGGTDTPPSRDFWYYAVFAANGCGDVSVASSMSGGTLDYHLGDVTDGITPGTGDNLVDTADISALGAHYGISLAPADPFNYLDVGPTTTSYVDGRPTTDNLVNFEDLVMFAINYGQVTTAFRTTPPLATDAAPAAHDGMSISAPNAVALGASLKLTLDAEGTGRVQAISTKLTWDPAVVELVNATAGEFLLAQGGVLMPMQAGTLDAAILGTQHGLEGAGALATVEFRAIATGDPKIGIASVDARDAKNQPVSLNLTLPAPTATPTVTSLQMAMPNPFRNTSTLAFSLAKSSPVEVAIYSVDGRLVRTLFRGTKEAGSYSLVWDGRDDRGSSLPGGVYFAHMVTTQGKFSRTLTRVR